jgi:SNF2 family DNA or RNA helicase
MSFVNPGHLGSLERFQRRYGTPIERYGDEEAKENLHRLVGPLILRRMKSDPRVAPDLPEKVETKTYCRLTEEQATLYEAAVRSAMARVEQSEGIERRGLVLSMLMQLKQICNHPVQFLHHGETLNNTRGLRERSGKLDRLTELLEEITAVGDRTLVFTQFAEMAGLLYRYLDEELGCPTLLLTGSTPAARRQQMVERFQAEGTEARVFVISLKAGGTGLNLTAANHVVHFDRWWNPAVEDQATDRAHRIGQRQNVQVHKFVTLSTLEEAIDEIIENKRALARSVIGGGEDWLTELSTGDLRRLVELRP